MHNHHHDKDCGCGHDHAPKEACGCGHDHHHDHGHTHDEHCNCGHDHGHTHDEHCGCGHDHDHQHDHGHTHDEHCGCGCGESHAYLSTEDSALTDSQADILLAIQQRGFLPVARFKVGSSKNPEAFAVALSPVYIADPKEDMETVKTNGSLFLSLEDMGLITLDYDLPLKGYTYEEYQNSSLYAYFVETVKEAAQKHNFAMDTPILELGSMALTEEGMQALNDLMGK